MRNALVPALLILTASVSASCGAQLLGYGLPTPQIQPSYVQPISAPSAPSLGSLPGLGQHGQQPAWMPPAPPGSTPSGPAPAGSLLVVPPLVTFALSADARPLAPAIIDFAPVASAPIIVIVPTVNAPAPAATGTEATVQPPVLANNALTVLSLPSIGLAANTPASLAPTSLAPPIYSPAGLAPPPIQVRSDKPGVLALPQLALPVVDMMGRAVNPPRSKR